MVQLLYKLYAFRSGYRVNFLFLNLWFIVFAVCAIGGGGIDFSGVYKRPILVFILAILIGLFEAALCVGSWALFYKLGNSNQMSILYAICVWLGYLALGTIIELSVGAIINKNRLLLKLTKNSYIEMRIGFDIAKYVSGDIFVKYFFGNKEAFSRSTQLKYIVDLMTTMVNGLIEKDKMFEYVDDNIVADHIRFLNGEADRNTTNAKAFIDFSKDDGYVAFMYWNSNGSFVEIAKVDDKNIVWDDKINVGLNKLKEWKYKLGKLFQKIGRKLQ
ncbi:MAG: hypothetical protein K2J01_02150 [Clostridiales bacterium]|nr:hypothetical protein [Clostridiales bacterium]